MPANQRTVSKSAFCTIFALTLISTFACSGRPSERAEGAAAPKDQALLETAADETESTAEGDLTSANSAFPQVKRGKGKTIAAPKVLPIVFASDPHHAAIADFTRALGRSSHWTNAAAEYGVGPMLGQDPLVRTDEAQAQVDDKETRRWLTQAYDSGKLGAPSAETLYALYYPDGVQVTVNALTSCKRFGGYHSEMMLGETRVSYAVIARCRTSGTDRDRLTIVASHEYFEWATNPLPMSAPAYRGLSAAHWAAGTFGSELADMCPFLDRGEQLRPSELSGYAVQRYWSNRRSAAGLYPCLPARMSTYAVAVPETPDAVGVTENGEKLTTKGITIARGKSRTIRVRLQGRDAALATPQKLSVVSPMGAEPVLGYRFELSSTTLSGGGEVRMTVTADRDAGLARAVLLWGDGDAAPTAWTFALNASEEDDDDD
jgi:hypothetical protein